MRATETFGGAFFAALGMLPMYYIIPRMEEMEPKTLWTWLGCIAAWEFFWLFI